MFYKPIPLIAKTKYRICGYYATKEDQESPLNPPRGTLRRHLGTEHIAGKTAEDLPGIVINPGFHHGNLLFRYIIKVCSLRKEPADHPVYVFVCAAFIAAIRVTIIDRSPVPFRIAALFDSSHI